MHLLPPHEKILIDRPVVVSPQGIGIVANVAASRSDLDTTSPITKPE
jgi:hypothetical protein